MERLNIVRNEWTSQLRFRFEKFLPTNSNFQSSKSTYH